MFLEISQSLFFNIKSKALAQVFPCEFCEISKNTFSYRRPPVAAFVYYSKIQLPSFRFQSSRVEQWIRARYSLQTLNKRKQEQLNLIKTTRVGKQNIKVDCIHPVIFFLVFVKILLNILWMPSPGCRIR